MNNIIWKTPIAAPVLRHKNVDIYSVSISSAGHYAGSLKAILNDVEEKRASKFHFEKDRIVSIVSRGVLKLILARYLSTDAGGIIISNDMNGKPFVDSCGHGDVSFNLSHSGDFVLYAVTPGIDVGIDIQEMREIDSMDDIVERYFSKHEVSVFNSLPDNLKKKAFYNCWSRKEAYIKALGLGLSYPLDSFSVSIAPGSGAELLADINNDVSEWSLSDIPMAAGYAAAVAVNGTGINYRYYRWTF